MATGAKLLGIFALVVVGRERMLVHRQRWMTWASGLGNSVGAPVGWHARSRGVAGQVALAQSIGIESVSVSDFVVRERLNHCLRWGQLGRECGEQTATVKLSTHVMAGHFLGPEVFSERGVREHAVDISAVNACGGLRGCRVERGAGWNRIVSVQEHVRVFGPGH